MKSILTTLFGKSSDKNLCSSILWKLVGALSFLIIASHPFKAEASTVATPTAINVVVDYLEETATVSTGSGISTKIYVSKDNKNWEIMSSNVLDISALLQTREVTLYFKGNKETTPTSVKLSGEDSSLKAFYSVSGGEGRVNFSGTSFPIEVRKGTNGQWKTIPSNNFFVTTQYETYGASLYFRVIGTATRRPGKIVSVKVPKRPTAPSVKLDGGKLYISGLKPGETQYRVGDNKDWTLFPASSTLRTMDLKDLLGNEVNTTIKGGTIEFRTIYNDSKKKVASSVKVIEVPAQPVAPENVTLTGTMLTAVDANKRKYYEYTIVQGTGTLDLKTAKWTSFTSAKPVIIKAAKIGDKIHVRAKSYTDSITKQVVPASISKEFTVQTITQTSKK